VSDPVWTEVDDYLVGLLGLHDDDLSGALAAADAAGLPAINVSAPQGMLLHLLARTAGARRILEVGTLAGYSTIWLARALPSDGLLVTLEIDPHHAAVAEANLARAGLGERVRVVVGPAAESLPGLVADAPFDLVFIDADKPSNATYVKWALALSRPGTLIVVDNVVRRGEVVTASDDDAAARGSREVLALLAASDRLDATVIQTVGGKGHDGFALARVR
jgi:predicted O-methyltransferase YrrM